MSKFVTLQSRNTNHPIFIDVDDIILVTEDNIVFVTEKAGELHDSYFFYYENVANQIKKYSSDKWVDLSQIVVNLGPLLINKADFKGINFTEGEYQIMIERDSYNGEIGIKDLAINDAIKIIDAFKD